MNRVQFTRSTAWSWVVVLVVAMAISPAMAIVGGTDDTSAFGDPASDYYGMSLDGIARARSGSAVAISNRHLLLAAHFSMDVGNSVTFQDGTSAVVTDIYTNFRDPDNGNELVDLKIIRVDTELDFWYDIYESTDPYAHYGQTLIMAGTGYDGTTGPGDRFMWDEEDPATARDWRWGTNQVAAESLFTMNYYDSYCYRLDYGRNDTDYEVGLGMGDSGSGLFINDNGEWKLMGINAYVYQRVRQYDTSYAVSAMYYNDWIESIVPTGDLDNNDQLNVDDIDQLLDLLAVMGGSPTPEGYELYDINSDLDLNLTDVQFLVEEMMGTFMGDLNLDGAVDAADLAILAANYGAAGDWGWSDGDINGDSAIDAADLALLATNYGKVANPVPEPMTMTLLGTGMLALLRRRR
jgi:hypothetical protein